MEKKSNAGFVIFFYVWSALLVLHFVVYSTEYNAPIYWSTWLIPILGLAGLVFPNDFRLFLLSCVPLFVDACLQAPSGSNHTILKNFVLVGFFLSAVVAFSKNKSQSFYQVAAPLGRWLLLIMYFFGVFHKINTDFLNIESGCAIALWQKLPVVFLSIYTPFIGWLISYGTLVVETVLMLLLVMPRLRVWGVLLGISFHGFLALSAYAFYLPFSTLTIALHMLFIPSVSAEKIVASPEWQGFVRFMRSWGFGCALLWFTVIYYLAFSELYSLAGVVWLAGVIAFVRVLIRGGLLKDESKGRIFSFEDLRCKVKGLYLIPLLFFFNCFTPYLGLKTAQSMNMFANLRLEGGISNHLIMSGAPGPFRYLEDLVEIHPESDDWYFDYVARHDLRMVYYEFLNRLERHPDARVSFTRNGVYYQNVRYSDLQGDAEEILHPRWFRGWFHFYPVDVSAPKACAKNR